MGAFVVNVPSVAVPIRPSFWVGEAHQPICRLTDWPSPQRAPQIGQGKRERAFGEVSKSLIGCNLLPLGCMLYLGTKAYKEVLNPFFPVRLFLLIFR